MAFEKSNLLYNDEPVVVGRHCARHLGVAEALVLQTLHFCISRIERSARSTRHGEYWMRNCYHDGHWWLTGTYEQMSSEDFNFVPAKTLRNILDRLESLGYVRSQRVTIDGGRRNGKRYRIDHEAVNALASKTSLKASGVSSTGQATLPSLGSLAEGDTAQFGQATLPSLGSLLSYSVENLVLENRDNNMFSEELSPEKEKEKAVVVALLRDADVWEVRISELIEGGITHEMVCAELEAQKTRNVARNRGGMLYRALRDRLNGTPWPVAKKQSAPSAKPLRVKSEPLPVTTEEPTTEIGRRAKALAEKMQRRAEETG